MILSHAQCRRFLLLLDSLIEFANERLGLGVPFYDANDMVIPEGQREICRELCLHPEVIDSFIAENPYEMAPAMLAQAKSWKNAIDERFFYHRHQDGSVDLLFEDYIFKLAGISHEAGAMLNDDYGLVDTTLLPFEGVIAYASSLSVYSVSIGAGLREQCERWFTEARDAGRVVDSAQQFCEVAPLLREQKFARDARQLVEDAEYDLNPPTEFPGMHRGVLADVPEERRDALVDEEALRVMRESSQKLGLPSIEKRLRSWCVKNAAGIDFASLAATEKNIELESALSRLGARRSSGLNKKQMVEALRDMLSGDVPNLELMLCALEPDDYQRLRRLYSQGGSMPVAVADVQDLSEIPHPVPLLCYLVDQGESVLCMIPDEMLAALKGVVWEVPDAYFDALEHMHIVADLLAETRGIVDIDEAFEEYARLYPGEMDFIGFKGLLLSRSISGEGPFELFMDSTQSLYLVQIELIDELSEHTDVYEFSPGVNYGELDFIENLFAAREGIDPWPLPDDAVQAGSYLDWARALPSARAFEQFLNEHVPDGKNDYLFADKVMDLILVRGTGGVEPASFVQYLAKEGLEFDDLRQANKMLGKLFTLLNDLPRWDNNGWPASLLAERQTGVPQFRNADGSMMKVGRNDPCPCGSGKKYKKCCGR